MPELFKFYTTRKYSDSIGFLYQIIKDEYPYRVIAFRYDKDEDVVFPNQFRDIAPLRPVLQREVDNMPHSCQRLFFKVIFSHRDFL